jgi:PAS domain S-box-containing protein
MKRPRNSPVSEHIAAQAEGRTPKEFPSERLANQKLKKTNKELGAARAELQKLNETLTALFQSAPDAIVTVDADGRIERANDQAESMFGYTRQELIGQRIEMLMPARFQMQHARHRTDYMLQPRMRAMGVGLELYGRRKSGAEFPVDIMLSPVQTQEGRSVIAVVRDITERKQAEEALRRSREELELRVQERTAELRQINEQLETEITDRKAAERVLFQTQLELARAVRVMTTGELAASIAHELNQPLTGVVTNGNACLRWLAAQPANLDEAREAVGRIIRDGNRASDVLARVRALMKKGEPVKESLEINSVVEEILALTEGEAHGNEVVLQTDLAANLPPVAGDRVQLQQVVLNLIMNAIEAMSAVKDRARILRIRTAPQSPNSVLLAVQDSGIGLDPAQLERIFDAFYTTKQGGMGIGLSVSRSIIEAHGGRLWAALNEGPGLTFRFDSPIRGRETL